MIRSKVYEKSDTYNTRNENLFAAVVYPVLFRPWQRHDKLRAGDLVLFTERVGFDDRAFDGQLVRALCAAQYFCRSAQRSLEQKANHAGMRFYGRADHCCHAALIEK